MPKVVLKKYNWISLSFFFWKIKASVFKNTRLIHHGQSIFHIKILRFLHGSLSHCFHQQDDELSNELLLKLKTNTRYIEIGRNNICWLKRSLEFIPIRICTRVHVRGSHSHLRLIMFSPFVSVAPGVVQFTPNSPPSLGSRASRGRAAQGCRLLLNPLLFPCSQIQWRRRLGPHQRNLGAAARAKGQGACDPSSGDLGSTAQQS